MAKLRDSGDMFDENPEEIRERIRKYQEQNEFDTVKLHWTLYACLHCLDMPGLDDEEEKLHYIVEQFLQRYIEEAKNGLMEAEGYFDGWEKYRDWKRTHKEDKGCQSNDSET